jgi:hypothetical protein
LADVLQQVRVHRDGFEDIGAAPHIFAAPVDLAPIRKSMVPVLTAPPFDTFSDNGFCGILQHCQLASPYQPRHDQKSVCVKEIDLFL